MKTHLIFLVIILFHLTARGEHPSLPLSKLQEGDWFKMNYIVYFLGQDENRHPDPWRADNILKTELEGVVIQKCGSNLRIAFSMNHLYYHQDQTNKKYQAYYDSYYAGDSLNLSQPIFRLDICFSAGATPAITYELSDSTLYFSSKLIPVGLGSIPGYTESWMGQELNYPQLIEQVVIPFLCNQPTKSDHAFCQLVQASFDLPHNTRIIFKPLHPITGPATRLSIGSRNYPLTKQADGSYQTSFFLSQPTKSWLGDNLLLTPGDSLIIRETSEDNYTFEGRGAANNQFYQEIEKHYTFFYYDFCFFFNLPDTVSLHQRIKRGKELYETSLQKYDQRLTPYWKKSAELSAKYWEITTRFRANWNFHRRSSKDSIHPKIAKAYSIPVHSNLFRRTSPFTDYLYQPQFYDKFLNAFFQYKVQQLNEDNLTHKTWWESDASTYYLQKQIFSDYPQIFRLAENLKDMMESQQLTEIRREYEDFLHLCKNPTINQDIRELWNQYMKIEPGANIKEVGLNVTSYLPLKKKADGYILLSDSYVFCDPQDLTTNVQIEKILSELNIKDKTALCYFRPESRRQFLPDSLKGKNIYTFLPDNLIDEDKIKLNISPWTMILMRNDGTILSREINKTDYGISHLKTVLENILQQPTTEKKYTKSEIYSFLLWFALAFVTIFTLVFTIIFVRFKRIRLLKKFSELKLQAIRSQMNPHFIFNALGSIQALILQKKNEAANRYLTDFSKLLRTVLVSSEKQLIPLSDEIRLLHLYLQLEQLRTPFEYQFIIEDSVCPDTEEIPGMLLQPLVENAIIHGIVPQGKGKITIHIYQKENILYCEICDNGPGLQAPSIHANGHKPFGLQGIEERLKLLRDTYPGIGIIFQDRRQEEECQGCRVILSIPV